MKKTNDLNSLKFNELDKRIESTRKRLLWLNSKERNTWKTKIWDRINIAYKNV